MPVGYLVTVTLIAMGTLLAQAPDRRPRILAALSFRVGLVFNELPFIALYLLLAATVLAIAEGDVDSAAGWLLVGVAGLVIIVGQAIVIWRALGADPAVERALRDDLGAGWRDALDPASSDRFRDRLPVARILLWPFPRPSPGAVERIANIRYGDAGRSNLLDLYRHRSHPSRAPVFVYVHGGGYLSGSKSREARPLIDRLASQGWVCISANYRLRPAASFPEHLIDLKKVIAWVRRRGASTAPTRRRCSWGAARPVAIWLPWPL